MLLIDDRTGSRELQPLLERLGLPCSLSRLDYGDFGFLGRGPEEEPWAIAVERKTIAEILSTIAEDGRLVGHQLEGLVKQYDRIYLVVEGVYRRGPDDSLELPGPQGWHRYPLRTTMARFSIIEGFLATIENQTGVHVRRTRNRHDTADHLDVLYRWHERAWDSHRSLKQFHRLRPRGPGETVLVQLERPSLVRRMAKELDGIGWERARAVERAFPHPLAMCLAPAAAWQRIEGIGPILSRRITEALQGPVPAFSSLSPGPGAPSGAPVAAHPPSNPPPRGAFSKGA